MKFKKFSKKMLSVALAVAILICSVPLSGFVGLDVKNLLGVVANAQTYEGFAYSIDNGGVSIINCEKSGNVSIPSTIDGYPVTSIEGHAFECNESIKSVTIPDSVTKINDWAFAGCVNLKNINLPDSIVSIGWDSFFNTAYYNDKNNWENGVLYIDNYLISAEIERVSGKHIIKQGTKVIADRAFTDCYMLTGIIIPDSVENIGICAFTGCEKLSEISIGDKVKRIGSGAFTHTAFGKDTKNWEDGVLCLNNYLVDVSDGTLSGNYGKISGNYIIRDGIVLICEGAFSNCEKLTSVEIPASVEYIGSWAFQVPSSFTSAVFSNINVSSDNKNYSSLDGVLFNKDKSLLIQYPTCNLRTSYSIPKGVKNIGQDSFCDCNNLKHIVIPEGVSTIYSWTFSSCAALETIGVPKSLKTVEEYAFYYTPLTDVYYSGTESDWEKIEIIEPVPDAYLTNEALINANIHCSDATEIFQENKYIADIWLNRNKRFKTTDESRLIQTVLDLESSSLDMFNYLYENKGFNHTRSSWVHLEAIFDGVSTVERGVSLQEIYETLILDFLQKIVLEEQAMIYDVIQDSKSEIETNEKVMTTANDIEKAIYSIYEMGNEEEFFKTIKNLANDGASSVADELLKKLSNPIQESKVMTSGEFFDACGIIIDTAKDVNDFIVRMQEYFLAACASEEMVVFLKEMKKNTTDKDLQRALSNVIVSMQNVGIALLISQAEFNKDMVYNALDLAFDKCTSAIPIYGQLKAIYGVEKLAADLLANVSGVIDSYYFCGATGIFYNASKSTVVSLASKYTLSDTEENAGAYVCAMKAFEQIVALDLDATAKIIKAATDEGLINLSKNTYSKIYGYSTGKDTETSYENILNETKSILNYLNIIFHQLNNTWKFNEDYLKYDYPDIYPIYVNEEISKEIYAPIVYSAKINQNGKTEINWGQNFGYYATDVNGVKSYYTLYGYKAMSGTKLDEKTGTYSYSKEYQNLDSVIESYHEESANVFDKYYSLYLYSETTDGKIYTPKTDFKVEYPLKKVTVGLPAVKDNLKWNSSDSNSLSIAITDKSSSAYTNIKYKIYRMEQGTGKWVLIDTVSRQFNGYSDNITIYNDDTAIAGRNYSYRVSSYMKLNNGITYTSPNSDLFGASIGSSKGNNLTLRVINPYSIQPRKGLSSQSINDKPCVELSWENVDGATAYEIYRLASYANIYELIATVDGSVNHYSDYNADNGVKYDYTVVSIKSDSEGLPTYDFSTFSQSSVEYNLGDVYSITWITHDRVIGERHIVGSKIVAPEVNERAGYQFIGWDISVPSTMPEKDITITALYEIINTDLPDNDENDSDTGSKPNAGDVWAKIKAFFEKAFITILDFFIKIIDSLTAIISHIPV